MAEKESTKRRREHILKVLKELGHPETAAGIMKRLPREFKSFYPNAIRTVCTRMCESKQLKKFKYKRKMVLFGLPEHSLSDKDKENIPGKFAKFQHSDHVEQDFTKRKEVKWRHDMDASRDEN